MPLRFGQSELKVNGPVRISPADLWAEISHYPNMAKKSQKTQRDFRHTWYFQEWAKVAEMTQTDVARLAGWSKATASDIWNGQQYTQSIIDLVAPILHAKPYELLMHPDEAFAIRRMREAAITIVQAPADQAPAAKAPGQRSRTGG